MKKTAEFKMPRYWSRWVREFLAEQMRLENKLERWFPIDRDAGYGNVVTEMLRGGCPALQKINPSDSGPLLLGRITGFQRDIFENLQRLEQKLSEAARIGRMIGKLYEKEARKKLSAQKFKIWKANRKVEIRKCCKVMERVFAAKAFMCAAAPMVASVQPLDEQRDFNRGFEESLRESVYDEHGNLASPGPRQNLYTFLSFFWPVVSRLKTSTSLYCWLTGKEPEDVGMQAREKKNRGRRPESPKRPILFHASTLGDLETFQRFCNRHEIRFGKRGRPGKMQRGHRDQSWARSHKKRRSVRKIGHGQLLTVS